MSVTLLSAYLGGLVTLLAPCSATLIPAFFAYAFSSKGQIARSTLVFFAGLLVALLPLGAAAGALSSVLMQYRHTIAVVTGVIIIVMGVWTGLALPFPHLRLPGSTRRATRRGGGGSALAIGLLGLSYGLAGAGCTGPILGAVLALAVTAGSTTLGVATMFSYALGMFTPIAALSLGWNSLSQHKRNWLRPRPVKFLGRQTTWGSLIGGALFVILGILLIGSGGIAGFAILGTSEQAHLENALLQAGKAVPNWLFLLLIVLLAALVFVLVKGGRNKRK